MPRNETDQRCRHCDDAKVGTKKFGKARRLPDGSYLFRKKGWEPPPCPEGYVRDKADAWHFLPLMPTCDFRISTPRIKICGAIDVINVCNCDGCPLRQQTVVPDQCRACPLRKVNGLPPAGQ